MRQLSPVDLQRRLGQNPAPLLLDVREPWEYAIARIDGSVNMPMSGLGAIWRDGVGRVNVLGQYALHAAMRQPDA